MLTKPVSNTLHAPLELGKGETGHAPYPNR